MLNIAVLFSPYPGNCCLLTFITMVYLRMVLICVSMMISDSEDILLIKKNGFVFGFASLTLESLVCILLIFF